MQYSFGNEIRNGTITEVLKVKSEKPVELSGWFSVERKNNVEIITDNFLIVKRIRAKRAADAFYTWYEIQNHARYVDKFTPGIKETEQEITDQDIALLEAEQEITDLDLRLMELEMSLDV